MEVRSGRTEGGVRREKLTQRTAITARPIESFGSVIHVTTLSLAVKYDELDGETRRWITVRGDSRSKSGERGPGDLSNKVSFVLPTVVAAPASRSLPVPDIRQLIETWRVQSSWR